MHLAIVEDLKSDRDNLIRRIQENSDSQRDATELSVYTSGEKFLEDFRQGFCNAIFLDIMLGDGISGLDTARKIREADEYIPIVFTTTEKDFALESYGVHAMDFLVKPIEPAPLDWCMKRLRETIAAPAEKDGYFLSSRHEGYGLGTASVRAIAQRYKGSADFQRKDGVFYTSVLLSLSEDV